MGYNDDKVKKSVIAKILGDIPKNYRNLRHDSTIQTVCPQESVSITEDCHSQYCLFDVFQDPTECYNLAENHTDVVAELQAILEEYRQHLVPNLAKKFDPEANPERFHDYWSPWLNDTM